MKKKPTIASLRRELKEVNHTLDLIRECDMRAIKRWQKEKYGRDMIWPDRTDMIFWLMKRVEAIQTAENYTSYGSADTTAAVKFLLATSRPGPWGGPHKWTSGFQRKIGKIMADYAKKYFNDNYQQGL